MAVNGLDVRVADVIDLIGTVWPPENAYEGDFNGLLTDHELACPVASVVIARTLVATDLDITDSESGLLICHEPFWGFQALAGKPGATMTALAQCALDLNRPILVAHSILDGGEYGSTALLVDQLGLEGDIEWVTPYAASVELNASYTLRQLATGVCAALDERTYRYFGDSQTDVKRVCVVAGGGLLSSPVLELAVQARCNCVVSGDLTESRLDVMSGLGLAAIEVPALKSEMRMLTHLAERLQSDLRLRVEISTGSSLNLGCV